MEAVLSAKTSGLCFNKDDFMVNDFSVDKFVSIYRKYVSLETLLADLGVYHRILCSAMIELINKDYADFLNLSSNLVGLDKSIKTLCFPLEKLATDVHDLNKNLHQTLQHSKTLFYKYSVAHKMKVLNHHALCIEESLEKFRNMNCLHSDEKIPLDVLERMALDFNVLLFHMESLWKKLPLKQLENQKKILEEVANCLKYSLKEYFLESLSKNDMKCLLRVLRISAVISMEAELEKKFAEALVKPYMKANITEENILKYGLKYVYDRILNFITSSNALLDVTRGTKKSTDIVPGFDFLVNSIFPEVVYCFDLITPVHIYAHGNPQKFHENYTYTMHFLDEFEHFCQVQKSVLRLRRKKCYEKFIQKWNLSVYFEIMFSEIAGKFEKCLLEGFVYSKDLGKKRDGSYLLNTSKALSECVKLCYNEKIFLKPLSHCFFRLNLKLISRFYKSTCLYLKLDNEESMNPMDATVVIRDTEMLIAELTDLFAEKIVKNLEKDVIEAAFEESIKLLEELIPLASSVMIRSLIKQCCIHLKVISDIPRLYRKTNREIPRKPSSYVALAFNKLSNFFSETESVLPVKSKKFCLEEVTNGIIAQCVIMIEDVLTAVQKMEHSLKILKRARDKTTITGSSGITPDDDKIRIQLFLDLRAVEEKVRELKLDVNNLKSFKQLKDLMKSTEKILPQNLKYVQ